MEYVTTGNIALLFMIVYSILKIVAPFTSSDKDDKALVAIDKAKAWVQENAPDVWAIIEAKAKMGQISGGAAKLYAFMEMLNAEHIAENGVPLPDGVESSAKLKASGLSAVDKIMRSSGNPPKAPVSQ